MIPTLAMSVAEFCRATKSNRLFNELERAYIEATGRNAGRAEKDSWYASLPRLSGLLDMCELPESTYIALEVHVPYYSERIDAALYGCDQTGQPSVLLIELKQWSELAIRDDERLHVQMRSGLVPVVHPSLQVDGYRRHLINFVRAFHNQPCVRLDCCVYAHNFPSRTEPLFDAKYSDAITAAPIFCATDAESLVTFIQQRVGDGGGAEIVDRIRIEGLAPSKLLIDRAAELIRQQDVFTMLDEQIPAQRSILRALGEAIGRRGKSIILVEGGPGTGKSVIALDAVGHALRKNLGTFLVSGSAAFTHGMRRLLGSDLASLIRFTDFFWKHADNSVDVLIVDEAHRVRAKSVPKVVAALRPRISQLEDVARQSG